MDKKKKNYEQKKLDNALKGLAGDDTKEAKKWKTIFLVNRVTILYFSIIKDFILKDLMLFKLIAVVKKVVALFDYC